MAPLGWLLLGGLLVYLFLWHDPAPFVLVGAEVAPATEAGPNCNVTVDVIGTIHTNSQPGTIVYRWVRSDGESTALLTQPVEAGRPMVQVHLFWTFAGKGKFPASATLQIIQPQPMNATGGFSYRC